MRPTRGVVRVLASAEGRGDVGSVRLHHLLPSITTCGFVDLLTMKILIAVDH